MSPIRPRSPIRALNVLLSALLSALSSVETSLSPSLTISRLKAHTFTLSDTVYVLHIIQAVFWLVLMKQPPFPIKLIIPVLYTIGLLIPLTSQVIFPATPIFAWLLTFYTSRFIPVEYRPHIWVSVLPTLESVLYGANISDVLTRFTHPLLDIVAWIPYGIMHFIGPFLVSIFMWLFAPKGSLKFWATVFGYMNLTGVWCQIIFPCAPPWYELIHGLTPANYGMPGSPGGLARIDALFNSHGYTNTFSHAPIVFGAFPSLHAGWATLEALVLSHFFPFLTPYVWGYTALLYWATMYLTHHYLIDVVGGACLATAFFYFFLPTELDVRPSAATRSKYEQYDLEAPSSRRRPSAFSATSSLDSQDEDEQDIAFRSPTVTASAAPFLPQSGGAAPPVAPPPRRNHRHTASIASLIRAEERVEDGWSPIGGNFALPPTPSSAMRAGGDNGIPRVRSPNTAVFPQRNV
ncbi:hypothetical protein M422DRAFT_230037 [Sphaerobolus stellatus SS14]|uniref:Phosphatidic acid phosphatase type 2/haloperoxidase domain-containing protein n=1 Tax=Sphaerobolus stellatus (strain SS14) TaxID=990650 RepID=A0A0C9VSF8_SPHS4|nr:hypothetical protein M422DRAFT_230037 [Sphaerobolus stellatus SS14]